MGQAEERRATDQMSKLNSRRTSANRDSDCAPARPCARASAMLYSICTKLYLGAADRGVASLLGVTRVIR